MNQSISVVVPAFNEEKALRNSIKVIHKYLTELVDTNFEILIIENGSTDRTEEIAIELDNELTNTLN